MLPIVSMNLIQMWNLRIGCYVHIERYMYSTSYLVQKFLLEELIKLYLVPSLQLFSHLDFKYIIGLLIGAVWLNFFLKIKLISDKCFVNNLLLQSFLLTCVFFFLFLLFLKKPTLWLTNCHLFLLFSCGRCYVISEQQ